MEEEAVGEGKEEEEGYTESRDEVLDQDTIVKGKRRKRKDENVKGTRIRRKNRE